MGILETAIGVIVGALVTVLASRYYFRRSIRKRIGLYDLLNSFVFDGISDDVRRQLQFRFQGREVHELQQLVFLIANDGERAVRDVIEPLTLTVPIEVEVLDASIVHREPEALKAEVVATRGGQRGTSLALEFPLLNKGDFFVVKLLLSGRFKPLHFSILCDDLPRQIPIEPLPPTSVSDRKYKFEWGAAIVGLGILLVPIWACYSAYLLHASFPKLFHPFTTRPGAMLIDLYSLAFLICGGAIVLFFLVLGLVILGAAIFGGEFPPPRGPRFRLPKDLQAMVFPFPYRALRLQSDFEESASSQKNGRAR